MPAVCPGSLQKSHHQIVVVQYSRRECDASAGKTRAAAVDDTKSCSTLDIPWMMMKTGDFCLGGSKIYTNTRWWFQPSQIGSFPQVGVKIKYLKPPPRIFS